MPEQIKEFQTPEELKAALNEVLSLGSFSFSSDAPQPFRTAFDVVFKLNGIPKAKFSGKVVLCQPKDDEHFLALEVEAADLQELKVALNSLDTQPTQEGQDAFSIQERIKDMPVPELIHLALRGNQFERRVLLKSPHKTIHAYILKNPKISQKEVETIARMPTLSMDMLMTIAQNKEWMASSSIRLAVVKNPKTPDKILQANIGKVNDQDLLRLAKTSSVKESVNRAAKRTLLARGKKLPS